MAKQKTIKELLEALKKEYNDINDGSYCTGLCLCVHFLIGAGEMSNLEHLVLRVYMTKHRPKSYDRSIDIYWFPKHDSASRNKWLDKHIKLNS
jgi:hypothetical protein